MWSIGRRDGGGELRTEVRFLMRTFLSFWGGSGEQGTAAVTAQRWLRKRKKCFTQRGCYRSWNFGTQRGEFDGTAASKVVEEKLRKHSSACDRPWIEPLGGMHLS